MAPVVKQFEWEQVSCVHYILPNKAEPDLSRGIHLSCGLGVSRCLHSKMDYPLIYHGMDEPPFLLGLSAHFSHKLPSTPYHQNPHKSKWARCSLFIRRDQIPATSLEKGYSEMPK